MKSKLGQMKIQQMAFMLITVVIFFSLVGMFLLKFQFSSLKDSASVLEEKNALLLVTKLANSPEFSCGKGFGSKRTNCVDADKVMALKDNIAKYSGFWGVSSIEIRKIYPNFDETISCTKENYPNCNLISIISGEFIGTGVSNFVALCRKDGETGRVQDKCELGKLIVGYEKK